MLHGTEVMLRCSSWLFPLPAASTKGNTKQNTTKAMQVTSFKGVSSLKTANSQAACSSVLQSHPLLLCAGPPTAPAHPAAVLAMFSTSPLASVQAGEGHTETQSTCTETKDHSMVFLVSILHPWH